MASARRCAPSALFAAIVLLSSSIVHAQSSAERYSLRGFGGWALGRTSNDNSYGYAAAGETQYGNYDFALNLAAQPSDRVSLRAQAFWGEDSRGRSSELDYVFAQWTQSPKLRLRVGKVLSPFGLYTETYDVGTLRPFYLLPQFYGGSTGLLPKSYLGGGVTGVVPLGQRWELSYDAFGGEMRFSEVPSDVVGPPDASGIPTVRTVSLQLIGRDMVGGRLGLGLPGSGLELGGAAVHASMQQRVDGGVREPYPLTEGATLASAYVRYERGPFALRSEYFQAFTEAADLVSTYAEASWRLDRHWQVAALYERSSLRPEAGTLYATLPEPLKRHEALGAALNLWATPDVVLKLNGYSVKGNLSARSAHTAFDALTGRLDDRTLVLIAGVQFSF